MMKKYVSLFRFMATTASSICVAVCLLFCSSAALALSVDWTGTYRFEAAQIKEAYLESGHGQTHYLLNHLNLNPKIIAADGFNIVADFEILGNRLYPNSQVGQNFGTGVDFTANHLEQGNDSNVVSENQSSTNLQVRELYLDIAQEYGEAIIGRAPIEFGLGMSYNAGRGPFDHWSDVHDMLAYKFLIGNLTVMPILARSYQNSAAAGKESTDLIIDIGYNNPETESAFGVFYRSRNTSTAANDANNVLFGNPGDISSVNDNYYDFANPNAVSGGWKSKQTNVFLARGWDSFKFKMEAGFNSGTTGLVDVDQSEIKLNGYGIALELEFPRPQSKWIWNVKTGLASGDNPTSTSYEGFQFNRNYDLGFLLFNHPMGGYDVLTSNIQRNRDRRANPQTGSLIPQDEALDEEVISNAIYLSPKLTYAFNDKLDWQNTLVYAMTQTNPSRQGISTAKDLGFEWDTGVMYRPFERVQWLTEIGFFLPGGAFKEGGTRSAGFNYGIQSKAAISF